MGHLSFRPQILFLAHRRSELERFSQVLNRQAENRNVWLVWKMVPINIRGQERYALLLDTKLSDSDRLWQSLASYIPSMF